MNGPDAIPPDWVRPPTLARAREVQRLLAERVVAEDVPVGPGLVAGADTSNRPRDPEAPVHAAAVLLDPATLRVAAEAGSSGPAPFPYVPGFLGFREVPHLLEAFRRLPGPPPALVLVDGHGISHPRGLGIAAQLGVLLDVPAIGVAKSILVGRVEGPLGEAPGSQAPLVWQGREIGRALRTRLRANPVFVSVGHKVSLPGAVRHVLALCAGQGGAGLGGAGLGGRGWRLPEPTRQAHLAANALRRREEAAGAA